MKIDLRNDALFIEDDIDFDKKLNFIFGKNGTGKSTITKLIKEQQQTKDVRIFQGFDSVLGEDDKLNAVILGEENTQINQQIEQLRKDILKIEEEKETLNKTTSPPLADEENFWTKASDARRDFDKEKDEINKFYANSASIIKRKSTPQIASTTYNTKDFQNEIAKAKLLQETEIISLQNILKSEAKRVEMVDFPNLDLEKYLRNTNEIIGTKVEEKIKINRLNTEDKIDFAKKGSEIHNKGEECAFCGNPVPEQVFDEIEKYFSSDEMKALETEIQRNKKSIREKITEIEAVDFDTNDFYSDFAERAQSVKMQINELKDQQTGFLEMLEGALEEKEKSSNMRIEMESVDIKIPNDFTEGEKELANLVDENNRNDLAQKQRNAKEQLRFHEIKMLLDKSKYEEKKTRRQDLEVFWKKAQEQLENELAKIVIKQDQIEDLGLRIKILQGETRNEEKLAKNINEKLENATSFILKHCKDEEEKGFYQVECSRTKRIRSIKELSTGEKNMIAFLYFIEKLNEIGEENAGENRIVVFDDPMNSNDDTMQYLMIDELQQLMKSINGLDVMIILTHNNHFYLNVKYGRSYKDDKFIRLLSTGNCVEIKTITRGEDDFKTSYEALWKDLRFLFDNEEATPEILLNPLRRIIDTYLKFNEISKSKFYVNQSGAKKLFDVNPHSIDDLEADLNGKTKTEIVEIAKKCFVGCGAKEHFEKHWGE